MITKNIPAIQTYLKSLSSNGASVHTIRSYADSINKVISAFSIETVEDFKKISKIDFLTYVNDMTISNNSKRKFLRNIRAFASWLLNTVGIDVKETFAIRFGNSPFPEVKKRDRVVLNEEEIAMVIGVARNLQERLMMEVFFHTMLRNFEVANIKISDIDGCTIKIVGKGGNESKTRLTKEMCELLHQYINDERDTDSPYLFYGTRGSGKNKVSEDGTWKPISGVSINQRVRTLAKLSGIDPRKADEFTTHRCRGTAITISNRTRGVRVTQLLARHANINTTMLYDMNKIDAVIDELDERTW